MDAIKTIKCMKSIKEKAEDVFPIEEYDSLETELQKRKMRLCYEHGANYVLEQIEKLTNNQNWCAFPRQSRKEFNELIEQLKK